MYFETVAVDFLPDGDENFLFRRVSDKSAVLSLRGRAPDGAHRYISEHVMLVPYVGDVGSRTDDFVLDDRREGYLDIILRREGLRWQPYGRDAGGDIYRLFYKRPFPVEPWNEFPMRSPKAEDHASVPRPDDKERPQPVPAAYERV